MSDEIRCLQCEQTREEVRRNQTICGTVSVGEYVELMDEWPRHHWRDWPDSALKQVGIRPEAYETYRRASVLDLEYAACEDTLTGHALATKESDREDFGAKIGQCIACGRIPTEATA